MSHVFYKLLFSLYSGHGQCTTAHPTDSILCTKTTKCGLQKKCVANRTHSFFIVYIAAQNRMFDWVLSFLVVSQQSFSKSMNSLFQFHHGRELKESMEELDLHSIRWFSSTTNFHESLMFAWFLEQKIGEYWIKLINTN